MTAGASPPYPGLLGRLVRWLHVPTAPPSAPPGRTRWVRSFGPAEAFLRYLKWRYLLLAGVFALLVVPMVIAISLSLTRDGVPGAALALILLGVGPLLAWAVVGYAALQLHFDCTWYVMTDRAIRMRTGIWVLRELTVSFDNVQNVKTRQGPLQRWLGIGDVMIETASVMATTSQQGGTAASTAVVAGVADPQQIRDRIVERMRASRSAGLGDPDDVGERAQGRRRNGGLRRDGSDGSGGWTPAHLQVLRDLRDEVIRMDPGAGGPSPRL